MKTRVSLKYFVHNCREDRNGKTLKTWSNDSIKPGIHPFSPNTNKYNNLSGLKDLKELENTTPSCFDYNLLFVGKKDRKMNFLLLKNAYKYTYTSKVSQ